MNYVRTGLKKISSIKNSGMQTQKLKIMMTDDFKEEELDDKKIRS